MAILTNIGSIIRFIINWISGFFVSRTVLTLNNFSPEAGWPGTVLTIEGQGFSTERDNNTVTVSGVAALILDAAPTRLQVLIGETTSSGDIQVSVAGNRVVAPKPFLINSWPDQANLSDTGVPRFFHGPQRGTPRANVPNQPVLVILCFPTDHPFSSPAHEQAQKAVEQASFQAANQWWMDVSYSSTSWDFTFTDWLALPRDRGFYFWQEEDITNAHVNLLRSAIRRVAVSGSRVYAANLGHTFSIVDATRPSSLMELSSAALGGVSTGVQLSGQYAYVTVGEEGLYVIDTTITPPIFPGLPWSTPAILTRIPILGWSHGLDLSGNILVVAAEGTGLVVYDISTPRTPVQQSILGFGHNALATAVRVVGTKAFVIINIVSPTGVDSTLRIIDLSNPAAPAELSSVALVSSGRALDVEGTLCGVATDTKGVQFFDISGPAPILNGTISSPANTYGIDISGTVAFVAAGNDGLHIINVATPSNPNEVGSLSMSGAYDVVVDSTNTAYVSVEALHLTAVDISTLIAPTILDTVYLRSILIPAPLYTNIEVQRALINVAIDSQDLIKRPDSFMLHALRRAQSVGLNLNTFEGIIVLTNGPFLRGQSWLANGFSDGSDTISFNATKGIIYMATNPEIARIAHEIGHWLGMLDMYEQRFANGTALLGTAAPWDIAGGGNDGLHLFSGFHMNLMQLYNPLAPNANIVVRSWSPTAPALNETFDIVAHDVLQDTDPARIHILKLNITVGLQYYIEVRQKQPPGGPLTFDRGIPLTNPGDAVVVITRVRDNTTFAHLSEREVMLLDTLNVGQSWADAARRLEIEVESEVQSSPRVYRIRLRWNQPDLNDPAGKYDLWITPWVVGKWETTDIWVDSPRNGFNTFESFEPGRPSEPAMNGDRPWIGRVNHIGARIHNSGVVDATNVQVSFYVNTPPGIGDNGRWFILGTKNISNIPANGLAIVNHDWVPSVAQHTCLRVEIMPQVNSEVNVGNNMAQENVFTFDSAGGSSHQPVIVETEVHSPFTVWKRVDLYVSGLPQGWHAVVNPAWVWLPPLGTYTVRGVIWTDLDTPRGNDFKIPLLAEVSIAGWTDFDHPYMPIGGILARVKATKRVKIQCDTQVRNNILQVNGCITPSLVDVPITVEITTAGNNPRYCYLKTDKQGCFALNSDTNEGRKVQLEKGDYTVQVFVTAGGDAAETECTPTKIQII